MGWVVAGKTPQARVRLQEAGWSGPQGRQGTLIGPAQEQVDVLAQLSSGLAGTSVLVYLCIVRRQKQHNLRHVRGGPHMQGHRQRSANVVAAPLGRWGDDDQVGVICQARGLARDALIGHVSGVVVKRLLKEAGQGIFRW